MYSRILVPIDGSATATQGLSEAIALARELKSTVVLLTVVNEYPLLMEMAAASNYTEMRESMQRFGEGVLAKGREQAQGANVTNEVVLREIPTGRAAMAIVEEASAHDCQLIVMGTHGRRGLTRLALGSDAELVVRTSTVPVLLVRAEDGMPT